jgi:hypothetical protein
MRSRAGRHAPPVLLILCAFTGACGTQERLPESADTGATDVTDSILLAPTPHVAMAGEPIPTGERDIGMGVLHFAWHEDQPREGSADTVVIRSDPVASAPVIARFVYTFAESHEADAPWGWRTETTEAGLIAADVEFDYEQKGLPVDSIAGDWVRVIYALTQNGEPRMGWTRLRATLDAQRWTTILVARNLYFFDDASPAFYSSPGGARVNIALARDQDSKRPDYTIVPEEISGPWMRVRIITPSNYCADPPNPIEHTTWIRFLDDRGRPRVFYASRGC